MKAQDFNVGNYIYHDWIDSNGDCHNIIQVFGVTRNYLAVDSNRLLEYESISLKDVRPIPLTEEWIIDFKDNFFNFNSFENSFRGKYYHFNIDGIKFYFFCDENVMERSGSSYKYFYVHQLQNLYKALTGKQLTK